MANRRNLKKNINIICSELFAECVASSYYKKENKKGDADAVMLRILNVQDEMIKRISHTQPGNSKLFYKKLYEDFNVQVSEIIDLITNLS